MSTRNVGIPGNHEDMARFFDARAAGYEQHMQENIEDFDSFYRCLVDALPSFGRPPSILDLGIGTGLELANLFERFPTAKVTGIDLSEGMLSELADKRQPWNVNVNLIQGSFLTMDLGQEVFDAVISAMALHHWAPKVKRELYSRIHRALRPGGAFVNADYTAPEAESNRRLAEFAACGVHDHHHQHIDLPLSPGHEQQLLAEAGFRSIRVVFERANACIFVASMDSPSAVERRP